MKITKEQIKKIIQEEIENLFNEVEKRPVVKPVPAPKGPVKEPAYYMRDTSTSGGDYLPKGAKFHRGYKDVMYREDPPDEQGRVTSMEKSRVPKDWLKRVEKPLKYDPKKHALEENDLDKTDRGPNRDGKIRPVAKIVPAPKGRVEEPKRFIVKDNPSAGIYTKDVDPPEPGLPGMPYQREMPSDHPERSILQTDPKNMEPVYKAPEYVEKLKPLKFNPKKHRTAAQKRNSILRAFKDALKESLDEVEPIPRRKVPHVHMVEEDVVSVKDLDLDETSSKARREEQVNETDRFKQALKTAKNLRRNTPADEERRKNDAAYKKGLKRIKRAVKTKKNKYARQPAKK